MLSLNLLFHQYLVFLALNKSEWNKCEDLGPELRCYKNIINI